MINEPEFNPLEDTRPTMTVPAVDLNQRSTAQRFVGLLSLLGALGFTLATIFLLIAPSSNPTPNEITGPVSARQTELIPTNTALPEPTRTPQQDVQPTVNVPSVAAALPTLSLDARQSLLLTPVNPVVRGEEGQVVISALNPFTIIPERQRNEMIKHVVQKGDTIFDLAARYGISQDSIAWSNDRRVIWTLTPGMELNIPPMDGVYYQAVGSKTLAELTEQFNVPDPYIVVDSPANPRLFGFDPNAVPPSGEWIFFPNGQAEGIDWTPPSIVTSGGDGTSGSSGGVGFQLSDPGSCGIQEPGAGTVWGQPMAFGTYTVTRGFSSWHPGIDLASSTGTNVYSANGGKVIFAGRNNWGYGLAVVISHGSISTLYGHLSQVSVSCGQVVSTGQVVGAVGSTGNSSGPHLHFEIMYNGIRSDPAGTLAF